MESILKENNIDIENEKETNLILERYDEAKNGKTKTIDESIKDFVNKREAWKSIV